MILSIDPSMASTGVCVINNDGIIQSYANIKTKKDGDNYYERVATICEALARIPVDLLEGAHLVIENQYLGNSPKIYGELCGLRTAIVNRLQPESISLTEYNPSTWRKALGLNKKEWISKLGIVKIERTVKGKKVMKLPDGIWKRISVEFVNETFNLNLSKKDDDKADAICLGYVKHLELNNK